MLVLIVSLSGVRYGIPTPGVVEVVPLVGLRPLPRAPEFVAGLFSYRGGVVPAIDLQMLTHQRPCAPLLSTRIIVFNLASPDRPDRLLGLIAEQVVEIVSHDADGARPSGVSVGEAPYLGDVAVEGSGETLQLLRLEKILPQALHELLYAGEAA